MVAAYAALTGKTVNIADAYTAEGFDFTGTRNFDKKTGYRSKSFLTVPMKNHENEIIGVLQLINAQDPASGEIVPFSAADQRLAESLASQAAIALTNRQLINQLEAAVRVVHRPDQHRDRREIALHRRPLPARAGAHHDARRGGERDRARGRSRDFDMSDKDRYELKIAGLLHDCGKVTTPVHVVDKATKLETIFDRIHLIDTRFEVLKRDAEIELLKSRRAAAAGAGRTVAARARNQLSRHRDAPAPARRGPRVPARLQHRRRVHADGGDSERVKRIAEYTLAGPSRATTADFLTDDEIEEPHHPRAARSPPRSARSSTTTSSPPSRCWRRCPGPSTCSNVPEYAGGHHERMDGKGYPRGLTREQMSVQARVMGIADIFEALTAKDRPYKKGKTLSESLRDPRQVQAERPHRSRTCSTCSCARRSTGATPSSSSTRSRSTRSTRRKIPGYAP